MQSCMQNTCVLLFIAVTPPWECNFITVHSIMTFREVLHMCLVFLSWVQWVDLLLRVIQFTPAETRMECQQELNPGLPYSIGRRANH
jgi:hypothetical protein